MYGAPVTGPMEVPQNPPSYFAQIPAELPAIKDATVGTLRLEGTLAKRLPPMPSGELQDLSFTNSKQLEAMQLMNEMRNAYGISRQQQSISKARAKQRNIAAEKQASKLGHYGLAKGKNLTARNAAMERASRYKAMQ